MRLSRLVFSIPLFAPTALAHWDDGHKIVATIAQMYLEPGVLSTICDLHQSDRQCHLAPLSTWADDHKKEMPWSANMHFVNPSNDNPPKNCLFPATNSPGWDGIKHVNVLDAIKNTTGILQRWANKEANDAAASEAVKFLIHFIGDLHQPMHVTGRARGGNGIKVTFGGPNKESDLHQVWDNDILEKLISRTPSNYTKPLPQVKVESALQGNKYDPFIRRIVWQGILSTWQSDTVGWLGCGSSTSSGDTDFISTQQDVMTAGVTIDPDTPFVCPHFWAQPIHQLNCDIAWIPDFDDKKIDELDTPAYFGKIEKQFVVEKLLAQGGIRLAGLLNFVFSSRGGNKGLFLA
ncbi:S1/P1 nuclease [Crepidotus variabilis]|uniref:S1/P1 nuclease n=1 Tax=Crepidotus variabilis TaxID=179855 RepID=A0A9P6EB43_9AGAR|nr:S1/P1 nuclease [Crepidotus variabilis]